MNTKVDLKFSKFLKAEWLSDVRNYEVNDATIVVNISNTDAIIAGPAPRKVIHPRKSTILEGLNVISAKSLVLIKVPEETNIGGMVLEDGWFQQTALDPTFPWDVPLYKSPQFDVGSVELDPYIATGSRKRPNTGDANKTYNIKVNVWFSPAKTNCGIHNHHTDPELLEVHTQVYGVGRMQKFRENDYKSIYEDVKMSPGFTHNPFAGVDDNGDFFYGWHQYYSDTDCIWMAIEHHPA
ncbi:hypothetical protein OS493_014238 [Desmophyllum pertusum]|uniref:Uncharacterized protein n=1 Tax=Desmophyllum pertusum TaxID=174260 RepID=A0A9W9Z155_9CNID|nr:hypothetical protein OS493_014238 [Desmophyllum pertusum]